VIRTGDISDTAGGLGPGCVAVLGEICLFQSVMILGNFLQMRWGVVCGSVFVAGQER